MGRIVLRPAAVSSDKLVKIHYHAYDNNTSCTALQISTYWRTDTFTTTTDNADLVVRGQLMGVTNASDQCGVFCMLTDSSNNAVSGVNETPGTNDDNKFRGIWYAGANTSANWATFMLAWHKVYTGIPAGSYRISVGHDTHDGNGGNHFCSRVDPVGSDGGSDNRFRQMRRHCMIWELEAGSGVSSKAMTTTTW